MTPFQRLVRQRPEPGALEAYKRVLDRKLSITWIQPALEGHADTGEITWHVGPELSRAGTYVKYAATYHSVHEGQFAVVLHVRDGDPEPDDTPEGSCELGTILQSFEWYEPGTDLVTLRDSGFRLSWSAAQWLYEAARGELLDAHHGGNKAHGALRARAIRLALFNSPYSHHDERLQPRHLDGEIPPPLLFLDSSRTTASDAERAIERGVLAHAIAELTSHPDPQIDRLLHDSSPGSQEVLRDLLLERGRPAELMLVDRAVTLGLERLQLDNVDDDEVDDELEALWHRVLELDPMIDTTRTEIFDLAGPVFE